MSSLNFKINAVYKELTNAVELIEKLEEKIKSLNESNMDFSKLNRQIAELEETIKKKTQVFAEMGAEQEAVSANAMAYMDLNRALNSVLGTVEDNAREIGRYQTELSAVRNELSLLAKAQKASGKLEEAEISRRDMLIRREAELKVAISEARSSLSNQVKMSNAAATSMDEMSQALGRMRVAYRAMTEEERNSPYGIQLRAQIKATDEEIKKLDASIGNHQRNVGDYGRFASTNFRVVSQEIRMMTGVFGQLPAPLQRGVSVMHNMTGAARKFIATPIGAVIAALVVAITALTNWFKKSETGMNAFAKVSGYTSGVLKTLGDVALRVGDAIYNAFANPKKAVTELWEHIKSNLLTRLDGLKGIFQSLGKIISSGFRDGYDDFGKSWEKVFFGEEDALKKLGNAFSSLNKAGRDASKIAQERLVLDREKEKIQDRLLDLESDSKGNQAEINKLKQQELDIVNKQIKLEEDAGNKEKVRELKRQRNAISNRDTSIKSIVNEIDDAQLKLAQKRAELAERAQSDMLNITQREIDLMTEGEDKKIKQIELNTDRELLALDKRRRELEKANIEIQKLEWEANGKQGRFTPVGLSPEEEEAYLREMNLIVSKSIEDKNKIIQDSIKEDQKAWNQILQEFGDLEQKRLAIVEDYDRKIAEARTDGEKAYLELQKQKTLDALDFSEFQKSINFAEVFSKIDDKSTQAVVVLRNKIASYLEQASGSLTPEQVKVLSDALIQADDIIKSRKPLDGLKNSIDNVANAYKLLSQAKKDGLDTRDLDVQFKDAMTKLSSEIQNTSKHFQELGSSIVGIIGAFDDESADMAGDILAIASGATEAGMGIAQLASGDIIGGLKSLASGISNVVNGIVAMNDKAKERQIARLQDQIEALSKSYNTLGNAIQNTYSKDASNLLKQQNQMLEQQKALIKLQIKEEEAKKKTDKKRIQQWKDELEEIGRIQSDNEKNAVDAIFGEDIQSAIDGFASAYLDAWGKGEDRAKAMKDVVKDMIRSAIQEMVKLEAMDVAGTVRKMITGFLEDDIIDEYEQLQLDKFVEKEAERLDKQFGWVEELFKTAEEQGGATYGAYERITQEQASRIDGRLTAIQMDNASLLEQSKLSVYAINAISLKIDLSNKLLDEIRMHSENMELLLDKSDKRGITLSDAVSDISRKVRDL